MSSPLGVSTPPPPPPDLFTSRELSPVQIRYVESVAATAWPAQEYRNIDGWRARVSDAPTRRVNSVFANHCEEKLDIEDRLSEVETFYRERDRPPRFQLTRASQPDRLDDLLAQRGYVVEAPVDIQISAIGEAGPDPDANGCLRITDIASKQWLDVYSSGFNRDVTAVFDQLSYRPGFAEFLRDGRTLGVGLGVLGSGWLGIFGMQTLARFRGRGIGSTILSGLISWAAENGARGVYLQVEQDNPRARALYERSGFTTVYAYHYRTLF